MIKRMGMAILGLLILIGVLGGIKALQFQRMTTQDKQFAPPPETVTAAVVKSESWESVLTAVGTIVAVQGVTVTSELTGKVVEIAFEPGARVAAGDLLIKQDTSLEEAQLRAAKAPVTLEKNNLRRARKLLAHQAISQSEYDLTYARYLEAVARVDTLRATIAKKKIRAPFAGRLGIRKVNLGQMLTEGKAIVSLQTQDPVFVNFSLPQQHMSQIKPGLTVRVTTGTDPGQALTGRVTTIDPEVDADTRNIKLQATLQNPREQVRPGMFVSVTLVLPDRAPVITIPATAVLYAPYSDSVFVVEKKKQGKESGLMVRQQFVRLGDRQGDFVAVISGLTAGQEVVSTGVFKLRSGQAVVVDNTLAPAFKFAPRPENR